MVSSSEHQELDSVLLHAGSKVSGSKQKRIDVDFVSSRFSVRDDGRLIWKERPITHSKVSGWNTRNKGKVADNKINKGYRIVLIDGAYCRAHRIVWAIVNKKDPYGYEIDHINLDRSDNRPENLRLSTCSQNKMNIGVKSNNTSGYKGVSWFARDKKWVAQIWVDKVKLVIGYFDNKEDAAKAYAKESSRLHKSYGRLV